MSDSNPQARRLGQRTFSLGGVRVEPTLLRVTAAEGRVTELSKRQMAAIVELAEHYGAVVSRARLHEILCLAKEGLRDRGALSQHIGIIRRAFGDTSTNSTFVKTIRGQGYCLLVEPTVTTAAVPGGGEAFDEDDTPADNPPSGPVAAAQKTSPPPALARGARAPIPYFGPLLALMVLLAVILLPASPWLRSLANPQPSAPQGEGRGDLDDAILLEALHAAMSSGNGQASEAALTLRLDELRDDAFMPPRARSTQLIKVGRALMCLRKWDLSSDAFEQALAIQRAQHRDGTPLLLARALTGLAQVDMIRGSSLDEVRDRLDEAERWLQDSSANATERARLWGAHAALMEFGADLPQADVLLARALQTTAGQIDGDPALTLQLRTDRARILTLRGRYDEATALTRSVLRDGRAIYGDSDRRLTPALTQQALLLARQGYHEEAAAHYASVVRILEAHYPDSNSHLIYARTQLAESLLEAGNPQGAASLYTQMIQHADDRSDDRELRLSSLRLRLSDALIRAQDPQRASEEVQKVRQLLADGQPLPDWVRYTANSLYGAALIELGDCRRGMQWLDDTIEEMHLGGVEDPRITAKIHARRQHYGQAVCPPSDQHRASLAAPALTAAD